MEFNLSKILKSKEAKYFFLFATGGVIQFIFGYALTFTSNYYLSFEDVGQFNYYFNLVNLLISFMSFGLFASYLRIIGEGFDKSLRFFVLSTYLILSFIYIIVCISLNVYYLIPFIFLLFFKEKQSYYRSIENTSHYLIIQITRGIALIICIGFLYFYNFINYKSLLFIVGVSYVVPLIISSNFHKIREGYQKRKLNLNIKRILDEIDFKKVLSISVPTLFTSVATWLLMFSDQYIIKMYYSFSDLGPYSVAVRLIIFVQIISSLFLLYYPKFYFKSLKDFHFKKMKFVRASFFLVLSLFLIILILSRGYLYQILGAEKFSDYSHFFIYLSIAEIFRIFASINFTYLTFIYKTKYTTYSILFISILNIFLNLLFLKSHGIIFAAYSTIISCVVFFLLSYFISIRLENKYIKINSNI
jgi:O-antigen/teichoic acid export membrane protein